MNQNTGKLKSLLLDWHHVFHHNLNLWFSLHVNASYLALFTNPHNLADVSFVFP